MIRGEDYTGISVVFLCHDGQGNYLLNKRSQNCRDEQGRWDPGGGGLDFDESVEDTLRREIKEEYNTDVIESEFLGYLDIHRQNKGKPTHWIALIFRVLVDKSKVRNNEPRKFDDLRWFKLDNLPKPLHSKLPDTLARFKDKLL